MPRAVYFPAPFQIFQRPQRPHAGRTSSAQPRTIHTNGTHHPEGPFGFWLGDSRAHWDGDTLVVDVVDFNDETWLDRSGNFHSDALHVVERWTLLDANTIEYRATLEDQKVFTTPWTLSVLLHRHRDQNFQLIEDYCFTHEYDEFYPFTDGAAETLGARAGDAMSRQRIARIIGISTAAGAALLLTGLAAAQGRWETKVATIAPGEWTGPRLPDGQPDIQGHWSNTIANHDNFTDPQGGIPGDEADAGGGGAAAIGTVKANKERAPSRVTDPSDGQVPFQPWARAMQQELLANFFNPTREEYVEPLARCAPAGPTKSFTWHGYEVRQYPGYVLFLFDSGTRIIHLDGKPHLPENIKLWNADSRGHWEGNTLVVDVRTTTARRASRAQASSRAIKCTSRSATSSQTTANATSITPSTRTPRCSRGRSRSRFPRSESPWTHRRTAGTTRPSSRTTQAVERSIESYEHICVESNDGHGDVVAAPTP